MNDGANVMPTVNKAETQIGKLKMPRVSTKLPLPDPNRLSVLVRTTSRLVRSIIHTYVDEHDLSFNQYLVLREVFDVPGITQRQLSTNIGIAAPTIVGMADVLVERGLLLRERSKADRRQTNLILTRAGRGVATSIVRRAAAINRAAYRDMTEREATSLRDLLMRANRNLVEFRAKVGARS